MYCCLNDLLIKQKNLLKKFYFYEIIRFELSYMLDYLLLAAAW